MTFVRAQHINHSPFQHAASWLECNLMAIAKHNTDISVANSKGYVELRPGHTMRNTEVI